MIFVANDNLIELSGLTDAATDAVITDATVAVTIYDSSGTALSGETWPLAMSHVADGLYRAVLDAALPLVAGQRYSAVVTAASGGRDGRWSVWFTAQPRGRN